MSHREWLVRLHGEVCNDKQREEECSPIDQWLEFVVEPLLPKDGDDENDDEDDDDAYLLWRKTEDDHYVGHVSWCQSEMPAWFARDAVRPERFPTRGNNNFECVPNRIANIDPRESEDWF